MKHGRLILCLCWTILLSSLPTSAFTIVDHTVDLDTDNSLVHFSIQFDKVPDFTSVNQFGHQIEAFQIIVDAEKNINFSQFDGESLIRGSEIVVDGDLRVRNTSPPDPVSGTSGGWGTIRGSVPFQIVGSSVTFTMSCSLLDIKGHFAYSLHAIFNGGTSYFKRFVSDNAEPDCSNALGSIAKLWPPNGALHPFTISGISDPDGDPVTLQISRITQDEPLEDRDRDGLGDANAVINGLTAELEAERLGNGNGRVYAVQFAASDGLYTCGGTLQICVPSSMKNGGVCTDDGQNFTATGEMRGGGLKPAVLSRMEIPLDLVSSLTQAIAETGPHTSGPAHKLHQNHPNPFNPETTIAYSISEATHVQLTVFSNLGQEVRGLVNAHQRAGAHTVRWDGRDDHGREVTSGLYLYRLETGQQRLVKKMILVK